MRWLKPNLKSIYSLLGKPPPAETPAVAFKTEAVRQMMLDTMAAAGLDSLHPEITRRISYAVDIQALWYVRSDLMTALASERGETFAQEKIAGISDLFEGLLPKSFTYQRRGAPDRKPGTNTNAKPAWRGKTKRR